MKINGSGSTQFRELRKQAEKILEENPEFIKTISPEDVKKLIHELHVHQIELEMQNDELRKTQLALEASRDRYADLYDFAPAGYFTLDENLLVIEANFTCVNLLCDNKYKFLKRGFSHYVAKDYQDEYYRFIRKSVETKELQTCEIKLLKKDGSQLYTHLTCVTVQDEKGNFSQIRIAISDINKFKRMERALAESEERYQNLFENAPDMYFTVSTDGTVTSVNQSGADYLGYSKAELVGNSVWTIVYKNDLASVQKQFAEILSEKLLKSELEFRKVSKNGSILWVHERTHLNLDDKERPVEVWIICRDISERKQLEAHHQQIQKMKAVSSLAGGIAHEFNNALCGIIGNIDLLQLKYPGDENMNRYFEQILTSSLRMSGLTDQLLAYARGGKYEAKKISLSKFIKDTLPLTRNTIRPSIHLDTDLHLDISYVETDLTQLQIVLSALLNNSSEAIDGKGHIKIITSEEEVDEEFINHHPGLKPGPYVCLTVEDDGTGMDEETRRRVFEPFFTTKNQGRGLGMASAYGIVKNHDGWISVYSELGQGTVVQIYLPAVDFHVKAVKKPKIEPAKNGGTILVIEDDEIVLNVSRAMLKKMGYRVLEAKTGEDAIDVVKSFDGDIDLALLDIKLPDTEGGRLYPLIMKARPNLRVIVCSGYSVDGPAQQILDAGAEGFIQKPFSITNLWEKLKEVLGDKK